jgi:hypothetical protein
MPRSALGSLPEISHEMVVGAPSEACSKVTVPVIFESPRTVATASGNHIVSKDLKKVMGRRTARDSCQRRCL